MSVNIFGGGKTTNTSQVSKQAVVASIASRIARAGDSMMGALDMKNNRIKHLPFQPVNISDACSAAFAIDGDKLRVSKAGDTMSGDLDMGGHQLRGLPTRPVSGYKGDEAASWSQVVELMLNAFNSAVALNGKDPMRGDLKMGNNKISGVGEPTHGQDAATKKYVDSKKPLITIWAEESSRIDAGAYEWSFGNGASGQTHADCGYTMLAAGRVLRMGLAARPTTATGTVPASITGRVLTEMATRSVKVKIVVNGTVKSTYGITKQSSENSSTVTFGTPLELAEGDRVNFKSITTNPVPCAVVSLLIELDL